MSNCEDSEFQALTYDELASSLQQFTKVIKRANEKVGKLLT
jgi:hypothetical protein